jgi:Sulfatase-modifying factor enzyme 1
MKPLWVLLVFAGPDTFRESRETILAYSGRKFRFLLATLLGSLLIGSLAFAGELQNARPSVGQEGRSVLAKATKEQPGQNSLGMKFVPVSGTEVLFSIWDTRVEDFRVFVESAGYDATEGMWSLGNDGWKQRGATWKDPGFKEGSTDPVVGVSWDDAKAFCEWLTKRERASGVLPAGMQYRLPTDQEWSVAVGLEAEAGRTRKRETPGSSSTRGVPRGHRRLEPGITPAWNRGSETNRQNGPSLKVIMIGTRGRVRSEVSRPIRMGCTIWEATCGSGVRIGTILKIPTASCAVRHGTLTTPPSCSPLLEITSRPIIVALSSAFDVFWLRRLRARRTQGHLTDPQSFRRVRSHRLEQCSRRIRFRQEGYMNKLA